MSPGCWTAGLLSLLTLAAAYSVKQSQASSAGRLPTSADQLVSLLEPAIQRAVWRALAAEHAGQQQGSAEAGQRALGRLEERLDAIIRNMTALQAALASILDAATACGSACKPGPESEPSCEPQPQPLPAWAAPHQRPKTPACARSCLQLHGQGVSQDGVYWLTGLPVPVLCDFSHDGGGWTLLVTSISVNGWNSLSIMHRNELSPSITDNYSILQYADAIRDLGNGSRFAYRIEAQAKKGRRHWGGVWLAPREYSFVDETGTQTQVSLVRRFDDWNYKDRGIEKRMPWLRGGGHSVLTTTAAEGIHWWGTLVTNEGDPKWGHSPWIYQTAAAKSGTVLYWMREEGEQ